MNELESLKEDLYKLVGELRTYRVRKGIEDEYFELGKSESGDMLNAILRKYENEQVN